jgi:hypothetical protein
MKILFVENRYTTQVLERVAQRLACQGHAVAWLVQNHRFAPLGWDDVHKLPYPSGPGTVPPPEFSPLVRIDRGVRYFGGNPGHYAHYATHIGAVLDAVRPEVVFGESTQFHELITVALCRRRGIEFLHPAATRIPHSRISFLRGDTLEAFGGSGERLPDTDARAMVQAVAQRRYTAFTNANQASVADSALQRRLRAARDRATMVLAWLQGERYVTPSPWRKLALERERRAALARVDSIAGSTPIAPAGRYVLYPMQMQPETNIDVWGAPHHDQAAIIAQAAASLQASGRSLVVKLNPTAKYDLLEPGFFDALSLPNVQVAPRNQPMTGLFAGAEALLTVTGSVLYESIFSCKPVFVLGRHALSRLPGVTPLDRAGDLGAALEASLPQAASAEQAAQVVQQVVQASYPGTWFDPLTMRHYDTPANLELLACAFSHVLQMLQPQGTPKPQPAPAGVPGG